jgi:hypothetical protein
MNDLLFRSLREYAKRGGRMVFWTCPKGCCDIVDWNHDILGGKSVATCRKCGTASNQADAISAGNDSKENT